MLSMKENRFMILGIISLIAAVIVTMAAFSQPAEQAATQPPQKRIAVLVPQSDPDYWQEAVDGIVAQLDERVSVQVTQFSPTDLEEQRLRFEMAVAANVDGMIVHLGDDALAAEMQEKATEAGIAVVFVGSGLPGNQTCWYAGSDHYRAGKKAGEMIAEATGGRASIAILSGLENQHGQNQRVQGIRDVVKKYPEIDVVCVEYSQMDSVQATQITQTLLKAHPEVNVFVGITSADIDGIVKTLEPKLNREAYHVIGFDASDETLTALEDGKVLASIVDDPYEIGRQAAILLEQILDDLLPRRQVQTDIFVITRDTLEQYNQWTKGETL